MTADILTLFHRFDVALRAPSYLAMGGQIIDAAIVAAPKQRNTDQERKALKQDRIPDGWNDKPHEAAADGSRRALDDKYTKAKAEESGALRVDLAIPAFGYKNLS